MPVRTRLERGADEGEAIAGVDRHYYERQVGPADPFDPAHAQRLAAAVAKDRARHKLIRAIRQADVDARAGGVDFTGLGLVGTDQDLAASRSIDGVAGASLDNIKL